MTHVPEIGEPEGKDQVARVERNFNNAMRRYFETFPEQQKMVTRPIGSEKVPDEQVKREWRSAALGPDGGREYLRQRLAEFAEQKGERLAKDEFVFLGEAVKE